MELVGARPLHLLTQTVPSLKSPTGAFIASQTLIFRRKQIIRTHLLSETNSDYFLFGPSGENRTHGLLNPIVLLSKTQCTIRYCLDSVSLNFKCIIPFCFIGCQDVSFLLWSNCGQTNLTNDLSPPAQLHRAISIFINRSCAFCLHELSIRRICQPCQ